MKAAQAARSPALRVLDQVNMYPQRLPGWANGAVR
jgi:hypothetical protein